MSLSHDAPCRLSRLMFTLLMALAFAGAPQWTCCRAAADSSPPVDLRTVADGLEKAMDVAAAERQALPKDTFDLDAVTKLTGNDSTAIFKWVRDHTNWIAYRGKLRGSIGVLMDRMGNSLDRAFCLAELLRHAGFTVRLAHKSLSAEIAATTLPRIRTGPPVPAAPPKPEPNLDEALTRLAPQLGVSVAQAKATYDGARSRAQQLAEHSLSREADQSKTLVDLLAASGDPPAKPHSDDLALAAFADHWWVQLGNGNDRWTDLDPTLPDAEPGQSIASVREAIPLPPGDKPIELPDSFQQVVEMHVIVERIDGRQRQTQEVLSATLRPSESLGKRVSFFNSPLHWPNDNNLFESDQPTERLKELVLAQQEFLPTLSIGNTVIKASSFDLHGIVNDKPTLDSLGGGGKSAATGAQAAADLFGGGKTAAPETRATGALIGEWIEYIIQAPGQPPRKFRRDIFIQDGFRPGAHADSEPALSRDQQIQRGLTLMSRVDLLVAPCQVSSSYVQSLSLEALSENKPILPSLLRDPELPHRKTLGADIGKLKLGPGPLYDWALARSRLSKSAREICIESPTVATYVSTPRLKPSGEIGMSAGFDLIDAPVALRPGANGDAFRVAVDQGVLDTNLEASLLKPPDRATNTAEMMAAGDANGVDWIVISDRKDPRLATSGLSAEALARIDNAMSAGNRVVIPSKPIRLADLPTSGWWQVNPNSGQTLGMMEDGRGESLVDYGLIVALIVVSYLFGFGIGFVGCMGLGASSKGKLWGCLGCAVAAGVLATVSLFAVLLEAPMGVGLAIYGADGLVVIGCLAATLHS